MNVLGKYKYTSLDNQHKSSLKNWFILKFQVKYGYILDREKQSPPPPSVPSPGVAIWAGYFLDFSAQILLPLLSDAAAGAGPLPVISSRLLYQMASGKVL